MREVHKNQHFVLLDTYANVAVAFQGQYLVQLWQYAINAHHDSILMVHSEFYLLQPVIVLVWFE